MRALKLISVFLFLASIAAAQSKPPLDENVVLEISVAVNQQVFHLGETIPIQASFKSLIKRQYQVNMAQYDRGGRMEYERFVVSPSEGAVDPLPNHFGSMGGLTSYQYLKPEPWTITLNLNEWIRFKQPGEYRLVVFSTRVGVKDPENAFGASPVTARSNEIRLKIVPADPEWEKQTFRQAVKALDAPPVRDPKQGEADEASRRKAANALRFLGTADAAREMVKRLRDPENDLKYTYHLGIISSPERSAARNAMEEALADPDFPIDDGFLYPWRMINTDPGANSNWQEAQRRALERLLAALPVKRGKALTISLTTAVNGGWNHQDLPKETMDKLVSQLISVFEQLPLNEQGSLLGVLWSKTKSPALIPFLKREAEAYQDFPEMREIKADESLRRSASALSHWYEMDPAGARPAVITEITRLRPRYDARVLGLLPDKTLPEVDFALAEHFLASDDYEGKANLASLISRYATEAILPQITEDLDRHIGKWACSIQQPILAYVLRLNPELARSRIEQAVAVRGKNFSACNHSLFQMVSEIQNDPVLEEIAVRSLDDPDPEVAMTAATMLGQHGSASAESALWRRYESWCSQWVGHESQLEFVFSDGLNQRRNQLGLGQNLLHALATGKSWLSDQSQLQRLSRLTTVRRLKQDLERYLKVWDVPPFTIDIQNNPSRSFWCRVAQYEYQSIDALKDKLSQFPPNTKFALRNMPGESASNDRSMAELREFLVSHGMLVVEEKR